MKVLKSIRFFRRRVFKDINSWLAVDYCLIALSLCLQLCAAIWKWSITAETCITNLGDWCKDKEGEEADKFYWASRPSDYMLTHFQLFSEVWCLNKWV